MIEPLTTRPTAFEAELRAATYKGGSGRGLSFWGDAADCGIYALLKEERQKGWDRDPTSVPPYDPLSKYALAVGGMYHYLHELWRRDRLPNDFGPISDASVAAAAHLFDSWRAHWPRDLYGSVESIESKLGVVGLFGDDIEVDLKPDLVTNATAATVMQLEQTRGLQLPGPGRYMVDFKTEGSEYPVEYYTDGLQATWYASAYNYMYPSAPVHGIIFDVLRKPDARRKDQTLTRDNFRSIYVAAQPIDIAVDRLEGLISQGAANIERARAKNLGNRAKCHKLEFGKLRTCPFYGRECGGT